MPTARNALTHSDVDERAPHAEPLGPTDVGELLASAETPGPAAVAAQPAPTRPPPAAPREVAPVPLALRDKARAFLARHGKKLWWLHSAYALCLGTGVVLFAQKGFQQARLLAISAGGAWLLVLLFFRLHGSGKAQASLEGAETKTKLRFYALTYALKNLYQGMLFFLLPFYWK